MLQKNDVLNETYLIQDELGRGGTSVVFLAYHLRLKKHVVVKRIESSFVGALSARTEVDILKNLHHLYLPQVYDILQYGCEVYTIMDYIDGQDMDRLLEQKVFIPENQLRRWLHQLLEVLDYLHTRRPPIIHSDIKPGNIILTPQGDVCLIDFNISLDGTQKGKISGLSPNYAAPEQYFLAHAVLQGQKTNVQLDMRTDLYSLAATFYSLITGQLPVSDRPNQPLANLASGRYTPDFLHLLDRAMAWQPGNRYPSARKMLVALERLKRQDARYRSYVAMQAASWLCSAALLAGGIFCGLRGVQAAALENYRSTYDQLVRSVEAGNDTDILIQAQILLEDETSILAQRPSDHAAVLHAVGDCLYNAGDHSAAATYYLDALRQAPDTDPLRSVYCSDAAIALSLAGELQRAQQLLQESLSMGISGSEQQLIQAVIYLQQGNAAGCMEAVEQVLTQAEDDLCARACLLGAQAQTDPDQELRWLQRAYEYVPSRETLRRLGAAYADRADALAGRNSAADLLHQALDCYETLCSYSYASREDRINLAVVQLSLGQADQCILTLQALNAESPDDYAVEMNLAFAYDQKGDSSNAAMHGSRALRLWREAPATDREPESSEGIQSLLELQRRLNF